MKSEIEVTKIFIHYIRQSVMRKSFELYRIDKKKIPVIPYENFIIENLLKAESPQMLEKMSFNDVWQMEDFIENDALALAVSELLSRQKFILYWKYVEDASDAQIGELVGISQQAVNKQRNQIVTHLAQSIYN